ncbi:hypothetical protein DSO57_1010538 [Entomophthora muscae]|uniref:Uncharacterized protein n=1 Tax=Entomophthora muscae TaxID=34485 RepID=A0ACC2SVN6_9FUNG|nr:hypothetical protein DSO57_1010538 [Entomophthora muscae]
MSRAHSPADWFKFFKTDNDAQDIAAISSTVSALRTQFISSFNTFIGSALSLQNKPVSTLTPPPNRTNETSLSDKPRTATIRTFLSVYAGRLTVCPTCTALK